MDYVLGHEASLNQLQETKIIESIFFDHYLIKLDTNN